MKASKEDEGGSEDGILELRSVERVTDEGFKRELVGRRAVEHRVDLGNGENFKSQS